MGCVKGFGNFKVVTWRYLTKKNINQVQMKVSLVCLDCRYPNYQSFSNRSDIADLLEIYTVFRFENILVSQMIPVII
jgi:ribosomal protein L33